MSISAPRYVSAPSPLTGRGSRVAAIAARELVRRATWGTLVPVTITYLGIVLIAAVNVAFASVLHHLTLATFETPFESPVWPLLMLIVATAAGAGSLAEDFGNRSFTLYRARPNPLLDYHSAKTIACGGWLLIAAAGPGLVAVAITAALGYPSATVALEAAGAYAAVGLVAAIFFTGLALALSSLTDRALYAGVAIFGIVLSLYIGAAVVTGITGNVYAPYANPVANLHSLAHAAFAVSGSTETDPTSSAIVLTGTGVVLWIFAYWRLQRTEVISE